MKQFIYSFLFFVSLLLNLAFGAVHDFSKDQRGNGINSIDANDTVVFDISQSTLVGNQVSFPVYIVTDETINAIDFSFMYDEMNFSLDSIINLTTYLQPVYNYNSGVLYFTSYSLQDVEHNVNLLSIRLNMLGHYLCSDDLDSLLVYLNGDACTVKVIECLSDAVPEGEHAVTHVYPNPTSGWLNISCSENAFVQLLDMKGSLVFSSMNNQVNNVTRMDVSQLQKGMYVLSICENEKVSFQKIVVE